MFSPLSFLLNIGCAKIDDQNEAKLTRIANAVSYLCMALSTVNCLQFTSIGSKFYFFYIGTFGISATVICLNYFSKHILARLVAIGGLTLVGVFSSLAFGKTLNASYLLFCSLTMSVMFFGKKHRKIQALSILSSIVGLVMVDYFHTINISPLLPKDFIKTVDSMWPMHSFDSIVSASIVVAVVFYEKLHHERFESELKSLNQTLELKVAEKTKNLVIAKELAEEANRSKTEFLANMSHELRTPIHIIHSARTLQEQVWRSTQPAHQSQVFELALTKCWKKMDNARIRITTLIDRLLELSSVESRKIEINLTNFNFVEVVQSAIDDIASNLSAKAMTVNIELGPDTPIYSDAALAQTMVENLLGNAVKYGSEGSQINVFLSTTTKDLSLRIINQGIGINISDKNEIFKIFAQGTNSKTGAGGIGVGLALCRQIADTLGGQVLLVDGQSENTEFELKLPFAPPLRSQKH